MNSHPALAATFTIFALLLLAIASPLFAREPGRAQDPLDQLFANPPEDSKPWCYWYWLNNNISKDGVTKDLEAMAKVTVNDIAHDTLWRKPYQLDVTQNLKPGTNRIRVLVTSTSEGKPAFGPTTLRAFERVIVE